MGKNILYKFFVVSLGLCLGCNTFAQSDVRKATNKQALQNLSRQLAQQAGAEKRHAEAVARRNGVPVRQVLPTGAVLELMRISPSGRPVFQITNNAVAADTVSTDELWSGGSTGLGLDGSGMTVGLWDDAQVLGSHVEFTGRVNQVDTLGPLSDHSTHVAGTLIAAGIDPSAKGMAFAASLDAYDWVGDSGEMASAAANGLLMSNHSYGDAAGWILVDPFTVPWTWWWVGGADPADVEDPNFGYYDTGAQAWDLVAFNAPYYLIVKSAGNDRDDVGPLPGDPYDVVNQEAEFLFTSTLPRNMDCTPGGYDCMPTKSTAKNILTVGAVHDIPGGYRPFPGAPGVIMSSFSGFGPTDDGRIKPDLVANGIGLISPVTLPWPFNYFEFDGTSMSAPNVTGSLLLLQEYFQGLHSGSSMRSATLKALAIHTADEAGGADGPDYSFGWGLLNSKSAAQVITDDGGAHRIIEDVLSDGSTDTVQINVNEPDAVIRATLVWTDPPGTPVALSLDPPDLMLVNDLDLRITDSSGTHMPWVLNPASPADAATTGDNFRDNVEQVVINGAGPGAYFIEVSHKGGLLGGSSQDYSLVISVAPRVIGGTVTIEDADFNSGLPPGWSIVSTGPGVAWEIVDPVPGGAWHQDNYTGGSGKFATVDNDPITRVDTELRTPAYDMSAHQTISLTFKTQFFFELFEMVTVDVSTDNGSTWTTAWLNSFVNIPGPSTQLADLTPVAAGESNVIVRFRYDSDGDIQGDHWQVDDVLITASGGELGGDTCGNTYHLPADQWRFIALPCNPGASNTVTDIFGDDMPTGDFLARWSAWGWDEATNQFWPFPDMDTPLYQGRGYFFYSQDSRLLDMTGTATPMTNSPDCPSEDGNCFEMPIVKPANALSELHNALGHPLPYPVPWADFRLRVDGDPGSPLTPSSAEAQGYISKVAYKYTGAAYVPYDDVTPGYDEGTLGAYDAFWVKALGGSLAAGEMTLLAPNGRATGVISVTAADASPESQDNSILHSGKSASSEPPPGWAIRDAHRQSHRNANQKEEEWYVRLTVEAKAEELLDDGNVLGQLLDSAQGFDEHDLLEQAPLSPYLTIVFPHDDWGGNAHDYTSDFHLVTDKNEPDEWYFEVLTDQAGREVTLNWTGPEKPLRDSLLRDLVSGELIEPGNRESYTFVMDTHSRQFSWAYEKRPGNSKVKK